MSRVAGATGPGAELPRPRGRGVLLGLALLAAGRGLARRPARAPSTTDHAGRAGTVTPTVERPLTLSGTEEPPPWRGRWALYGIGALMIGWGLRGLLRTPSTRPPNWAKFFLGGVIIHDLIFLPLIAVLVAVGLRWLPARYRSYAQAGLLMSGSLTLVALPVVLRYGRRPDDPSTLPLPYGRNLLIVLAVLWGGVVVTAVVNNRRRRDGQPRGVIE